MAGRSINFDTLGDRSIASSRLRAWMLADELRARGHDARVNSLRRADVQVFQKVRPAERLRFARQRGALVVADFDDNYLLEEVGTRDDVVRFMNCVDLVTVGSPPLLEAARVYHDRVALLENPLDVPPHASVRPQRPWSARIGWFGNPTNLSALEALGLEQPVTTITKHGDIEWSLDTVDAHLIEFDLVLLPVAGREWNLAKNANRLLKCVALGVPFLASRTPEHERIAELLQLPDDLFVDSGESWEERIESLGERYEHFLAVLGDARALAVARYGIGQVAEEWLAHVEDAERSRDPARPVPRSGASLRDLDVLVLNENEPWHTTTTLSALGAHEPGYRSVTVVSAWPDDKGADLSSHVRVLSGHRDFFDVYASLAAALPAGDGGRTLILRAGAQPTAGFFSELDGAADDSSASIFTTQLVGDPADRAGSPPEDIDQALRRPFVPDALVCPNDLLRSSPPLVAELGAYALWDLLLSLMETDPRRVRVHAIPLVLVDPVLRGRSMLDSFYAWMVANDERRVGELPSRTAEWPRLRHVLFTHVIERHRATYERHVSALLPALERELLVSEQARDRLVDAHATLRAELNALARWARGRVLRATVHRVPPTRRGPILRAARTTRRLAAQGRRVRRR